MVAARQACFQDGENECNNSTALVEYEADDAPFVDACGYFLQQLSKAQLEYRQSQSRKRGIYAINTQARPRQMGTRPLWRRSQ
jgi:hypothetical protein